MWLFNDKPLFWNIGKRRTKWINKDLKMWIACIKDCLDVFQMKSTLKSLVPKLFWHLKLKLGSLSISNCFLKTFHPEASWIVTNWRGVAGCWTLSGSVLSESLRSHVSRCWFVLWHYLSPTYSAVLSSVHVKTHRIITTHVNAVWVNDSHVTFRTL